MGKRLLEKNLFREIKRNKFQVNEKNPTSFKCSIRKDENKDYKANNSHVKRVRQPASRPELSSMAEV